MCLQQLLVRGAYPQNWDVGDHIQKVVLGVADELYIYGVVLLAVEIWELIW